jgi:CHAT domain-containing protein/Tfp pilus assembly protein PilF
VGPRTIRRCVVALALLLTAGPAPAREDKPQPLTAEQKEKLKERDRLLGEIQKLLDARRYEDGLKAAERIVQLNKEALGEGHLEVVKSLSALASLQEQLQQWPSLIETRKELLRLEEKRLGKDHWAAVDARWDLRDAERLARMTAEERGQVALAVQLNQKVARLYGQGKSREAIPAAQQAVEIRKKALGEDHPDYATSLNNLAELYQRVGEPGKALPLCQRALEIRKKALGEDHPAYAESLNNLAELYRGVGEPGKALPLCQRALEIRKKALGEEHPRYADSLNNLALLYQDMGEPGKALPLCQRALEIEKKALGEDHPLYAISLNNLATLYQDMGEPGKALPLCQRALEIEKKALGEDHPFYAQSLNNLALLYMDMGEPGKALPLYQRALEIDKKALGEEHPRYADSLNNLAVLYQALGEHGKALPLCQRALEIRKKALGEDHSDYAISLNNLATLYQDMGEPGKALPLYQRALEIEKKALGEDHPLYAVGLHNLAMLYQAMGEHDKAMEQARQAQAVYTRTFDDRFTHLSEQRRGALLARVRHDLDHFLTLADEARAPDPERYAAVARWKGIVAARRADERWFRDRPELKDAYRELQEARARLSRMADQVPTAQQHAAWLRQLADLREAKEKLEAELARRSEAFREGRERTALTPAAASAALPDGVAFVDLLEYDHVIFPKDPKEKRAAQRRLLGFVLRKGHDLVCVPLGKSEDLQRAVADWRKEVEEKYGQADPKKLARAARAVREQVWEPLVKHFGDGKTVLIAPDGVSCQFPFAALPGAREGTFLIEDYALGYVTSAHQVVELNRPVRPRKEPKGLLAVGGIDYGKGDKYPPLVGAGPEVARSRDLFRKAFADERADLLDGDSATVERVSQACDVGYRYLHLATHGYFESRESVEKRVLPALRAMSDREQALLLAREQRDLLSGLPLQRCGLALAGANRGTEPSDPDRPLGVLTGEAVEGLDLRGCELAVLSACQTGLGDLTQGDGVRGLQRAFAAAGARSVAVSLWSVNDAATAVLMDQFYTNLWDKKMGKLEALRQAQLYVLKNPDAVQKRGEELLAAARKRGVPEELLRGPKGKLAVDLPDDGKRDPEKPRRSPEAWWAAFVLSGDWR